MSHHQILIIGGGTAGIMVAALLCKEKNAPQVTIIDPSSKHYYQPLWTLVGAGVFPREESEREMGDYIPEGAEWIQQKVISFDPDNNAVMLDNGEKHTYDYLVVAAGIKVDWEKIKGLKESLGKPGTGVVSNYDYHTAEATWEAIQATQGGNAIFTHPSGPIKCGGAPIKIAFLASHYWRKQGMLNKVNVHFIKGGPDIFAVPKYAKSLTRVADDYGVQRTWKTDLIEIRAAEKKAVFRNKETKEQTVMDYSMLHVSPPMSAPIFIKNSPLADKYGWVEVDKYTTQHVRYPNVFSLGDSSSLPTSKTGAAIRKQAPVTAHNIMAAMEGKRLPDSYDGYTSCPLVTGYGSLIMAEFDYNKNPKESFPFDQSKPRYSMYALKAYGLPRMYWHGMLKGREF